MSLKDIESVPIRKLNPEELERCVAAIKTGEITDVYPEWFGAVGDGITNDSDALQQTIDAVGKRRATMKLGRTYNLISALDNEREMITVKAPHKPFFIFITTQLLCLFVAEGSRRGMYPAMLYTPATTLMQVSLGWFMAIQFYLGKRKQPASPATQPTPSPEGRG